MQVGRRFWREYSFTQREIENHLRSETQMMNFVEVRLRPNVHIQPEEVEAYYRAQVLPDLEKAGVKVVTLQEVEPKIRELLVQQHMDELLDAWLHNLRQQTPVRSTVPLPASLSTRGHGRKLDMAENATVRLSRFPWWFWVVMAGLFAILVVALGWFLQSPAFREIVRNRVVSELEKATGGDVEMQSLTWNVSKLEVEAKGITIRGLEPPTDVPLVHIDRLFARVHIVSFFEREH